VRIQYDFFDKRNIYHQFPYEEILYTFDSEKEAFTKLEEINKIVHGKYKYDE